jgi:hypothetical protein
MNHPYRLSRNTAPQVAKLALLGMGHTLAAIQASASRQRIFKCFEAIELSSDGRGSVAWLARRTVIIGAASLALSLASQLVLNAPKVLAAHANKEVAPGQSSQVSGLHVAGRTAATKSSFVDELERPAQAESQPCTRTAGRSCKKAPFPSSRLWQHLLTWLMQPVDVGERAQRAEVRLYQAAVRLGMLRKLLPVVAGPTIAYDLYL